MPRPTAVITGASMGIGEQIAHVAAADQHDLVLVARSKDRLENLAAELTRRHAVDVRVEPLDLVAPGAVERLCTALEAVEIDVLVNNAGLGCRVPFREMPMERIMVQIDLNLRVLTELTRRLLPPMVERRRGRILNIASTAAFQGWPWQSVYAATKAYVVSLSEALAIELAGTGVTVTVHCPGGTRSEFGRTAGSANTRLFRITAAEPDDVARHAWRAAMRGRTLAVHGHLNQFLQFAERFSPRKLNSIVAGWLNQ